MPLTHLRLPLPLFSPGTWHLAPGTWDCLLSSASHMAMGGCGSGQAAHPSTILANWRVLRSRLFSPALSLSLARSLAHSLLCFPVVPPPIHHAAQYRSRRTRPIHGPLRTLFPWTLDPANPKLYINLSPSLPRELAREDGPGPCCPVPPLAPCLESNLPAACLPACLPA